MSRTTDFVIKTMNRAAQRRAAGQRRTTAHRPLEIRLNAAQRTAEILIYGVIGQTWWEDGISAAQFAKDLQALGELDLIKVRINSGGGDAFDGIAIYNTLSKHSARVRVEIEGLAASAASIIAMAGDEIVMSENALMMIHQASSGCWGTADDMAKSIDLLRKLDAQIAGTYASRSGSPADGFTAAMVAETWYTAAEAQAANLCTEVSPSKQVPAAIDNRFIAHFKHPPQQLVALLRSARNDAGDPGMMPDPEIEPDAPECFEIGERVQLSDDLSQSGEIAQIVDGPLYGVELDASPGVTDGWYLSSELVSTGANIIPPADGTVDGADPAPETALVVGDRVALADDASATGTVRQVIEQPAYGLALDGDAANGVPVISDYYIDAELVEELDTSAVTASPSETPVADPLTGAEARYSPQAVAVRKRMIELDCHG